MPEAQAKGATKRPQFNHVDAPFPSLTFADKGLRLPDLLRQANLGEASALPVVPKDTKENGVIRRMDGLFHCALKRQWTSLG